MKIASMKKEKPSIANPRPKTLPQQAHLETEDRARYDPGREQGRHHLRPALRQRPVELVAGAQVEPLDEQHQCWEGDPEADERNVHREGERLHLPRLQQVVLIDPDRGGARQEQELAHLLRLRWLDRTCISSMLPGL